MKSKCMQVLFVGKRLNSDEKHFTVCTVYLVENIFGNTEDSIIDANLKETLSKIQNDNRIVNKMRKS